MKDTTCSKDYELRYCEKCIQATNHKSYGDGEYECMKCWQKAIEKGDKK